MASLSIMAWKSEPALSITMNPKDMILQPIKLDKSSDDSDVSNLIISSEVKKPSSQMDDFLDIIGDRGPWQLSIWIILLFASFFSSWHNLSMAFLTPTQKFWCALPQEGVTIWKNVSFISTELVKDNPCYFVNVSIDDGIMDKAIPCTRWEYEKSVKSSLISQWNLVCEKEWLIPAAKSIYMIGSMVAMSLAGFIMNRFGRRITVFISCGIFLLASVATSFSKSMPVFLVLRFFASLGLTSVYLVTYVTLMTSVGFNYRSDYYIMSYFGWPIGYALLPVVAWLINEWFYLQLAITVPCFVILLPLLRLLPESDRWLVNHNKMNEAVDLLKNAAAKNQNLTTDVIEIYLQSLKSGKQENKNFDTKMPRVLLLHFCWFSTYFFYYGLSWDTNFVHGNPYANFALSGSAEVPSIVFVLFASLFIRQKLLLAGSSIAGGCFLISVAILCKDPMRIPVALVMMAKFFITSSSILLNLFSFEMSSFAKGNVNLQACFAAGFLGAAVSPFVAALKIHRFIPFLTFGGCCLLSGLLTFFLPDQNIKKLGSSAVEKKKADN